MERCGCVDMQQCRHWHMDTCLIAQLHSPHAASRNVKEGGTSSSEPAGSSCCGVHCLRLGKTSWARYSNQKWMICGRGGSGCHARQLDTCCVVCDCALGASCWGAGVHQGARLEWAQEEGKSMGCNAHIKLGLLPPRGLGWSCKQDGHPSDGALNSSGALSDMLTWSLSQFIPESRSTSPSRSNTS